MNWFSLSRIAPVNTVSHQVTTPTKRLFFALWPEEEVVKKIKRHALKHFLDCQGRTLKYSNWHITLAYFGASDSETQSCLEAKAATIKSTPFELNLSKCGFWSHPQVAWLAPNDIPDVLKQLVYDLQQAIIPCGFKPDARDYNPHVTIVRKAKTFPAVTEIKPINMKVTKFCLVESKTFPEGAEYQVLKSWDFSS